MLHPSLLELIELAGHCATRDQATGVLAESHQLMLNALEHDADTVALLSWYSEVLTAVLENRALGLCPPGCTLIPAGTLARHEVLPQQPIRWTRVLEQPPAVAVRPGTRDDSPAVGALCGLGQVFAGAGIASQESGGPIDAADPESYINQVLDSGDPQAVAGLADQLCWLPTETTVLDERSWKPLRSLIVGSRPPQLKTKDGLPDGSAEVDLARDLIEPVAAIARWAAVNSESATAATLARLSIAAHRGVLTAVEAEDLEQVWRTGVHIWLWRWARRVETSPVAVDRLPAMQRSAYGAAARTLAVIVDAIAMRTSEEAIPSK